MALSMRRILMSVAVVTVMAALMVAIAAPAFAVGNGKDYGGGKEYNWGQLSKGGVGFKGDGDAGMHGVFGNRGVPSDECYDHDRGTQGEGDYGVGNGYNPPRSEC